MDEHGRAKCSWFDHYNGLNGELVRELFSGTLSRGSHSVVWGGRDNNNVSTGSGAYVVKLTAGNRVHTVKAVKAE